MNEAITFFVPGIPRPGGSKKAFYIKKLGRAVITDASGENGKQWRQQVAAFARDAYDGPLLDRALEVHMTFVMPRPKGHSGKRGLKASAPRHPMSKPDVLKLARSTEDAITNVIWRDDSTTIRLVLEKRYGEKPGALITIRPLTQEQPSLLAGSERAA